MKRFDVQSPFMRSLLLGVMTTFILLFLNISVAKAATTDEILSSFSVTPTTGNTIASDAASDATASATSQAAVGFEDGGIRIYAPNFGFGSVPVYSSRTLGQDLSKDGTLYPDLPTGLEPHSLIVNDYSESNGWQVYVALGEFRNEDGDVLNVKNLTLNPYKTHVLYGQPTVNGTTDPQQTTWERAYKYSDVNAQGKSTVETDSTGHAVFNDDVPQNNMPWQFEDPIDHSIGNPVQLVPFDDSAVLTDSETVPDTPYNGDDTAVAYPRSYDDTQNTKHQSLLDKYNSSSSDDLRNNFHRIWGAGYENAQDRAADSGYHGKGWWALSFYDSGSAELNLEDTNQEAGFYTATMYWVLTSDPIS